MKLLNFLVMLFLLGGAVFFVACEGDMGPAGPAGKDGKDGEKGDPGAAGAQGDKGNPAIQGDPRCDVVNGVTGVLDITGTKDDDVICGNKYPNIIAAGTGNDTVYGGDGIDFIRGNEGNDTIYGEAGSDVLYGDEGDDTLDGGDGSDYFYLAEPGTNKFIGGGQSAYNIIWQDTIIFSSVENINASQIRTRTTQLDMDKEIAIYQLENSLSTDITFDLSSGTFDGSSQSLGVFTFEGIENVVGGKGNDNITGDAGNNYLRGEAGNDVLNGGAGDDILRGLQNKDTLTGETGSDTFVLEYLDRQWVDIVKDFSAAQKDKIQFKDFPAGDSARALAGSAGIISVGGTNVVEIQVNGSADETLANTIRTTSTLYEFVD